MVVEEIEDIAVLGAGVMGHGIAQVAATSGYNVFLSDIEERYLERGRESIYRSLAKSVERDRIIKTEMEEILDRISYTLDLDEAVGDADLVIEAVPERMNIKKQVWRDASTAAPDTSILATNTSSLSINEIAKSVSKPERFLGMHFFNPPVIMNLVELILGKQTTNNCVDLALKIVYSMGKTPVKVRKDSPGFIVNRILITYLNEAAKLLNGYSKRQIDAAMHYREGMPMGPFMLMDLIGIDITYDILKVFEEEIGPGYASAEPIKTLYNRKKFGRKTGEGFYSYDERPKITSDQAEGFDTHLLMDILRSEAEKVVEEGIASKEDVNKALELGANIPNPPFKTSGE
ncbi:MAG: 3-hydroxyacyl-CoA dehydrogenase NAD-binding domain-containing protein [Candidatus Bathyarchaeia archaeon]